jgi:site-specific recombinase XerD
MKLSEGIELYVERKRMDGLAFAKGSANLFSFCRQVGNLPLDEIRVQHFLTFLDGPRTSLPTWRGKHSLLKHFFEFCVSRGVMPVLLIPPPRPPRPSTFVPYIYTRPEIHKLLTSARVSQRYDTCAIDAQTIRTILITLYSTGALVGEILNLSCADVDIKAAVITIRSNRYTRSRCIPVSSDLRNVLQTYADFRHKKGSQAAICLLQGQINPFLPEI